MQYFSAFRNALQILPVMLLWPAASSLGAVAMLQGTINESASEAFSVSGSVSTVSDSHTLSLTTLPFGASRTAQASSNSSTATYAISGDASNFLIALDESQSIGIGHDPIFAAGHIIPVDTNTAESSGSFQLLIINTATPYLFYGSYDSSGTIGTVVSMSLTGPSAAFSYSGNLHANDFPASEGILLPGTYTFQYDFKIGDGSGGGVNGPGSAVGHLGLIVGDSVPEPASIATLGLGAMFLLHRTSSRRRHEKKRAVHYG